MSKFRELADSYVSDKGYAQMDYLLALVSYANKTIIERDALEQIKEEGPKRQLVGFTVDDKDALIYGGPHGNPIYKDGEKIGKSTKFTCSYINDTNIGYALIEVGMIMIYIKTILPFRLQHPKEECFWISSLFMNRLQHVYSKAIRRNLSCTYTHQFRHRPRLCQP